MAITQTGAIYKSLSFDNTSSRNYGVYITGEAVYNAPERAVEMISIPGRNGAFALDQGRFENIEVSYPAGIFAENESDFAAAVSDFRNFLCSKKGYCRLTDEYNPNEYRMAVYKSGLEVDSAQLKAGEFTITFDCKPQRWLTSGETASTVANNGTMTNPTLFDASPLLEVTGYGTIGFNGYEIELESGYLGDIILAEPNKAGTYSFSNVQYNTTDVITLEGGNRIDAGEIYTSSGINNLTYTVDTNFDDVDVTLVTESHTLTKVTIVTPPYTRLANSVGTSYYCTVNFTYKTDGNETRSATFSITNSYLRDGTTDYMNFSALGPSSGFLLGHYTPPTRVSVNSTVSMLGNPTYVDCDLGEAYLINGTTPVSLNAYIDLGSDLPKLAPGSNTFTKDNTITQLKVTPRWWRV